ASLRSRSAGRPSLSRIQVAKSVKTLKLAISPTMIRIGWRPDAPPASRTGSTGRTHGESAVATPARNPSAIRSNTGATDQCALSALRRVLGGFRALVPGHGLGGPPRLGRRAPAPAGAPPPPPAPRGRGPPPPRSPAPVAGAPP